MPALSTAFSQGTHAARPAAALANTGYYYLETDTGGGTLFQSTGTAWVQLSPSVNPAYTVQSTSVNYTVPSAEYLIIVTVAGLTITLPDAATYAGRSVDIFVGSNNTNVGVAGSDMIDADITSTTTFAVSEGGVTARSNGSHWCIIGGF